MAVDARKNIILVFYLSLGLYVALGLSAILTNAISYDEPVDYHGTTGHLWHAYQVLSYKSPDYSGIFSNTEYYGVIGRLPGYLLFFFHRYLFFGSGSFEQIVNTNLVDWHLTGFVQASHFANLLIFLALVLLSMKVAHRYKLCNPWLVGLTVLTLPVLIGHSFMNTKDIPTTAIYTLFTCCLIQYSQITKKAFAWWAGSAITGGFLISTKVVFFPPVVLSLIISQCLQNYLAQSELLIPRSLLRYTLPQVILAVISFYLVTPPAWLEPVRYFNEAFNLFSNFDQGGGCTYLLAREFCLGSSHHGTLFYILLWISSHIPLITIVGLIAFFSSFFRGTLLRVCSEQRKAKVLSIYLLLLLQVLLVPCLAIIGKSNLYDADRHFLFIYPPMMILASVGLEQILAYSQNKKRSQIFLNLGFGSLLLSICLLHPYQYVFANEIVSPFTSNKNTSLDYWAFSATEAVQHSILHGGLSLQPIVRGGIPEPPPLAYAVRSMGGNMQEELTVPEIHFAWRNPKDFFEKQTRLDQQNNCRLISEVTRRQLLGSKLTLSKLYRCD